MTLRLFYFDFQIYLYVSFCLPSYLSMFISFFFLFLSLSLSLSSLSPLISHMHHSVIPHLTDALVNDLLSLILQRSPLHHHTPHSWAKRGSRKEGATSPPISGVGENSDHTGTSPPKKKTGNKAVYFFIFWDSCVHVNVVLKV